MRNIFLGTSAFLLSSCTSLGIPSPTGGPLVTIQQVQAIAAAACGFLPTATTVANIIIKGQVGLETSEAVARAICAAVYAANGGAAAVAFAADLPRNVRPLPVPRPPARVAGVPIKGKFLSAPK